MMRITLLAFSFTNKFSAAAWMPASQTKWQPVIHQRASLRIRNGKTMGSDSSPTHINILPSLGCLRGGAADDQDAAATDPKLEQSTSGVSIALFVTYLTVMGAKCALPSTLSSITSSSSGLAHYSTTLTRQDVISRLLAFSTLSIAVGKLALGPLIDSIGGINSLRSALTILFICLGCIGFGPSTCPTLTSLAGYWIIIDFAFSSCWAACIKTIRDYMDESRWSKEIGQLAMAARTGNASSFAFFAWLLQMVAIRDNTLSSTGLGLVDTGWRWVFRASSVIQLIPLSLLYFSKRYCSHVADSNGETATLQIKPLQSTMKSSLVILANQARTPEFWLHLFTRTIMMVLISFLMFIPTFMTQCYDMSTASAARVGSLFAMGCLSSVITLSEKVYPASSVKSSYKQKSMAMLGLLAVSTLCLSLQYAFLRGIIQLTPMLGSFLMFIWGFALSIPFYIPGNMFALKRGGKEGSATIADAFDVSGFGLLAIFNSYVAKVLSAAGNRKAAWSPVFLWMMGGSAISMVSMLFAVLMEGKSLEQ
jgi:MFS family permease